MIEHKTIPPQIYNLRFWAKGVIPEQIKDLCSETLHDASFKVLNFSEHHFPVQGYTAIWLLAESHLAVHTFPSEDISYYELSGCNKDKTILFKEIIQTKDLVIYWDSDINLEKYPLIESL